MTPLIAACRTGPERRNTNWRGEILRGDRFIDRRLSFRNPAGQTLLIWTAVPVYRFTSPIVLSLEGVEMKAGYVGKIAGKDVEV